MDSSKLLRLVSMHQAALAASLTVSNSCSSASFVLLLATNLPAEMTELFVKMAEDALPAIRQRLDNNAQCRRTVL